MSKTKLEIENLDTSLSDRETLDFEDGLEMNVFTQVTLFFCIVLVSLI
jgi:hypothetical protein